METSGRYGTLGPDSSTYFSVLFYYYFHFSESTNKTLEIEKNRTSILKKE